jgi:L-lysine exporter family protein LysE/ArgO
MISAWLTGFATSFALILAIGAQNAMVLRQGLARSHVFWACLFCALSDAILIALGVAGFSIASERFPLLPIILTIGGILFLLVYGIKRLLAAIKGDYEAEVIGQAKSLGAVIAALAAVTWLNPHVYLDTLALLGAISAQYEMSADKLSFGIGAVMASFTFFFALGYGAAFLAPYFQSASMWRIFDTGIAIVMFLIAFGLYLSL